jgi:membrane protease YdiL (CAAX protease family)
MTLRLAISLAAFVVWTLITVVGGQIHAGHGPLAQAVTTGLGWPFLLAAGFLLAVSAWQRWHDMGLNRFAQRGTVRLAWLPLLYIVVALTLAVAVGLPPAGILFWILLNTFLVGLSEELMFRGVLLQAFRHAVSIWPAVVLTTLAFGAIHSLNVFTTGDLYAALLQSTAAGLSGLLFIALRLRTGSLWPPILVHGLWDFATFTVGVSAGGESPAGIDGAALGLKAFLPILLVLPNALYGLWLMRHIGRTHAEATP